MNEHPLADLTHEPTAADAAEMIASLRIVIENVEQGQARALFGYIKRLEAENARLRERVELLEKAMMSACGAIRDGYSHTADHLLRAALVL